MNRSLIAFAIASVLTLVFFARADASPPILALPQNMQEPAPPGNAERAMFTEGQSLFLQGSYTRAAETLEKFLETYPHSILTDLTLLWLGRSYFQLGRFAEAEELGKRLRAIKDTPFADIYDAELKTAIRARQQSAIIPERTEPAPLAKISEPAIPRAGRERYAKGPAPEVNPPSASVKKKSSNPTRRALAKRSSARKSGQLTAVKTSAGKSVRHPVRASANAKPPSSSSKKIIRPGSPPSHRVVNAANRPPRRSIKNGAPDSKAATATVRRLTQGKGKIAAKSKPSSRRQNLGREVASRRRSVSPVARITHRAPHQAASMKTASNRKRGNNPGDHRAVSDTPGASSSADLPTPRAGASDDSRPTAIREHVATGGLYSMIDTALAPAPGKVAPETQVDAKSKGMNAKPGETIYLSFVIRNYGNTRQTYELRVTSPGSPEAQLYVDSNGDGMHQSDELKVTGSPVIELKNGEVPFLLEVSVPRNAAEGQQYFYTVTVLSFGTGEVVGKVTSTLTVSSIRASLLPVNVPENSRPSFAK